MGNHELIFQFRCTLFNRPNLIQRACTFLHDHRPTGIWLEGEQIFQFGHTIEKPENHYFPDSSKTLPQNLLNEIKAFEFFNSGLAEYF